jgi:hypothetical protein
LANRRETPRSRPLDIAHREVRSRAFAAAHMAR